MILARRFNAALTDRDELEEVIAFFKRFVGVAVPGHPSVCVHRENKTMGRRPYIFSSDVRRGGRHVQTCQ